MNIREVLSAIHSYYQEHKPEEMEYTFFPPATQSEIDAVQSILGPQVQFPDDLRQLYLQHGMLMGVWDSIDIMTLEEIPTTHERLLKIAAEYGEANPVGPVSSEAHTSTRIPFAAENELTISIDLRPPAGGRPGQIVRLDLEFTKIEVVSGSLSEFFLQGLERLKAGN